MINYKHQSDTEQRNEIDSIATREQRNEIESIVTSEQRNEIRNEVDDKKNNEMKLPAIAQYDEVQNR